MSSFQAAGDPWRDKIQVMPYSLALGKGAGVTVAVFSLILTYGQKQLETDKNNHRESISWLGKTCIWKSDSGFHFKRWVGSASNLCIRSRCRYFIFCDWNFIYCHKQGVSYGVINYFWHSGCSTLVDWAFCYIQRAAGRTLRTGGTGELVRFFRA